MTVNCIKETSYNLNLTLSGPELEVFKAMITHLERNDIKKIMEAEREKEFQYGSEVDEVCNIYNRFLAIRNVNIELSNG